MLIYDCINKKSTFFIEDDVIKFMKFEIDFNQGKYCTTPDWINEQRNN